MIPLLVTLLSLTCPGTDSLDTRCPPAEIGTEFRLAGSPARGWSAPVPFGIDARLRPLFHRSALELGQDTTGWIARRGRHGRWQLEAWQVRLLTPLDPNPDAHVHLNFRLPLPARHERHDSRGARRR